MCVIVALCSQETSTEAADEPNDQDVVLIKEETAKEEVNSKEAADELLLNEDGKRGNTVCHATPLIQELTLNLLSHSV